MDNWNYNCIMMEIDKLFLTASSIASVATSEDD